MGSRGFGQANGQLNEQQMGPPAPYGRSRPSMASSVGGLMTPPSQRVQRGSAPRFGMNPNGADAMTGVSRRQYANQPNAVEAARGQQQRGSGLGASIPQPKNYVDHTNRTYAAPRPQMAQSPVPTAPPLVGPPPPATQQPSPVPMPQAPVPQPQAPLVTPPRPPQPPVPGVQMNERDLRDKEAMQ